MMEISILLAKILGPMYIVIAIGILLNMKNYQTVMEDFSQEPALIYLGGLVAFIFGIIIVLFHNIWMMNGRVIITIIGWMALIKGVWLIVFPRSLASSVRLFNKTGFLAVSMVIVFILGALLTIMGYFLV
jgi:hypothetical protein